jgi:hypothetical protein
VKVASSQITHHKISNGVNGSSSKIMDRNIFTVKVSINKDDVNIHTMYVAHARGNMCHADVNMVVWQHQRFPCVTRFFIFWVNSWTNEKDPLVVHKTTWQSVVLVVEPDYILDLEVFVFSRVYTP